MTATFYNYLGVNRKIDKGIGDAKKTCTVKLKDNCSLLTPSLLIEAPITDFVGINYVYIDSFKRYYFIDGIISVTSNLTQVKCNVDVLYTYRNSIKQMSGMVSRSSKEGVYNQYLEDSEFVCSSDTDYVQLEFTGGSVTDLATSSTILVVGGAVESAE